LVGGGQRKSCAYQAALSDKRGGRALPPLYNTTKQTLLEGKQVFSFTQSRLDVEGYCENAKHYDYRWFEMQHSTLEFRDVEQRIAACPSAGAIPMLRRPDAQEWHIQHSTDIGALGVINPNVDDVEPRGGQLGRASLPWRVAVRVAARQGESGVETTGRPSTTTCCWW
jgi:hypothetical protein